jgi:hypothetical protein
MREAEKDDEQAAMSIVDRGLRNVPWSGGLWKRRLRLLMKLDKGIDELRG